MSQPNLQMAGGGSSHGSSHGGSQFGFMRGPSPAASPSSASNGNGLLMGMGMGMGGRQISHSALPMTMEEIASSPLPAKYTKTEDGSPFLIVKDNITEEDSTKCWLLFMSDFGKELLKTSKYWYSDGTFATCPPPFSQGKNSPGQIYVLFAEITTKVFPCAYAVLPNKCSETYERFWSHINHALTNGGEDKDFLGPDTLSCDFEMAPSNEFLEIWPEAKLVGCFFHWRKALLENLGKKGCKRFYNKNPFFQDLVACCIAMALVPEEDIIEYWTLVEDRYEMIEEDLSDEAINYFTYFTRTYIGKKITRSGGRRQPLFKHSIWNKYSEVMSGRETTSNKVEAWNRAYKIRSDNNVSVWSMLDSFRREEAFTKRKWREDVVNIRDQPPQLFEGTSRQIAQRDKAAKIHNVVSKAKQIPKEEYLDMLCVLVKDE